MMPNEEHETGEAPLIAPESELSGAREQLQTNGGGGQAKVKRKLKLRNILARALLVLLFTFGFFLSVFPWERRQYAPYSCYQRFSLSRNPDYSRSLKSQYDTRRRQCHRSTGLFTWMCMRLPILLRLSLTGVKVSLSFLELATNAPNRN